MLSNTGPKSVLTVKYKVSLDRQDRDTSRFRSCRPKKKAVNVKVRSH